MNKRLMLMEVLVIFIGFFVSSCRNENDVAPNFCYPDAMVLRTLNNAKVTILASNSPDLFYMKEEGAVDTTLEPCNLPKEFQVDSLKVVVSGEVQDTHELLPPCCVMLFVIKKISK